MNQPFKYDKPKNEIWLVMEKPNMKDYMMDGDYTAACMEYNSRLHFTVSPEPDWEDGKIVRQDIDFTVGWSNGFQQFDSYEKCSNTFVGEDKSCHQIAIPLPKEAK